jgi:nucleotide sugar dehydrogenase
MKIGIIGNGFVGKATRQLKCTDVDILVYDINPNLCIPNGIKINDLLKCELIFISVPTPMNKDGSCHINIVKTVVNNLKEINYNGFIIIRSTVPPGTCDKLQCYFMPEFLTEKNYINDFINNKEWIFGVLENKNSDNFKKTLTKLINISHKHKRIIYNNISFVSNKEAELIKMFRNCFLATKISFCNEIFEYCKHKNINYETVRKIATLDNRIGDSHTKVPGHDGKKGYGGTCFPKDINSLNNEIEKCGLKSYILKSVIERNENIDRPENDWKNNFGRSVI